jgi:hypothetical protein
MIKPQYLKLENVGSGSIAREAIDSLVWSNSSATTVAATDSSAMA